MKILLPVDGSDVSLKAVRLVWDRKNNRPVERAEGALEGSMDQEEGHG